MVTQLSTTLHGVIRDYEGHFQEVVYKAVESALIDLGDQIYSLDWANVSVSMRAAASKAA